ncbi:sigma-54-dependent Fis family transcriptional regulator [Roseimaritima ulvae]|uniref:Formate hydrogenlyase transcriptional activator n=1 Tax=Roseimaritima ulvae TaxID=980254 RepID=A0A5B9QSJ6_9BACT|nr:sigma 54-interacting transcriptional regulator [Roseimaritima ulvae]QEG40889.1 Formate hydrogenlyase transcriptional activator [Roseimaritima ulvae]
MHIEKQAVFGDPKAILLAISGQHHLPELLPLAVRLLAPDPRVALARIWLRRPPLESDCGRCRMAAECHHRDNCLYLVASYGHALHGQDPHWEGTNGAFRRMPLGVRKIGHIASSGETVQIDDVSTDLRWIVRPEWVRDEQIRSFFGLPLRYHNETLGVLALFSREAMEDSCREWLRMIADHLAAAIANARSLDEIERLKARLQQENEYLREEVAVASFGELVGNSPALQMISQQIDLVAPTDSSVLILGESGTGKELIARELHRRSNRSDRPLIKVNCAAVPRELYESEFFGHSKGSFTGAVRDRAGRFELADGGTLFLDEIGEIPLDLQAKLLRVLQEGELERIGEEQTRRLDVRVIAATNRNLREEAAEGRFRQDLFYRLSVFPIELAPLRERVQDIPLLAEHFLTRFARQLGRKPLKLTLANVQRLQRYAWPGNVRELQHVLERAVIISTDGKLRFNLPEERPSDRLRSAQPSNAARTDQVLSDQEVRSFEKENIRRALSASGGKVYGSGGAAERLGLKPTTLLSRMRAFGIQARP